MITSKSIPREAYVWIWLPHATQPVVSGKLTLHEQRYAFNYGKSYLERDNAIALYDRELPLKNGFRRFWATTPNTRILRKFMLYP